MALYKWSVKLAGIGSFPDQIQYMSQDDYNALSEEAKMNGTTYGIVGNGWLSYTESLKKLFEWGSETTALSENPSWTYGIPDWTNLIYISWYWQHNTSYWWIWISALFTRWLPNVQYLWQTWWNYAWWLCTVTVDWEGWTVTITRQWQYWDFKDLKMTFC